MTKRELPENARLVPQEANKVFSGKIFDVYQWQQKLYDGSIETFEMLKRPDSALIIALDDNDQVIALKEEQPSVQSTSMGVPGGRIDPEDDDTLSAAKRELLEETGYTMKDWKLVEIVQPFSKIEWFMYLYVARGVIDKIEPHVDAGEKIEVYALPYEQFCRDNYDADRFDLFKNVTTTTELKALFD